MRRSNKISHASLCLIFGAGFLIPASNIYAAGGLSTGNLGQGIATIVIFTLLCVILGKYAWKPIIAQLAQREADIAKKISDAENSKQKSDEIIAEYEKKLSEIDIQAQEIFDNTRAEANVESQQILKAAHTQATTIRQTAQDDIDTAKTRAQKQLQAQTAQLATQIAKHVISRKLTDEDHEKMLSDATEKFAELSETSSQ